MDDFPTKPREVQRRQVVLPTVFWENMDVSSNPARIIPTTIVPFNEETKKELIRVLQADFIPENAECTEIAAS